LNQRLDHPQAVLHALYSAIVQGDFDRFGELVTDDVELHICGFTPMNGDWRGRNEVVAATRRNFGLLNEQRPEIEGMIAQGDIVAVLIQENGLLKADGARYSLRGVQWFRFEDGKVKQIDEVLAQI